MLFKEITADCSKNHKKSINTLWGQNGEKVIIEAAGAYCYHWALKGPKTRFVYAYRLSVQKHQLHSKLKKSKEKAHDFKTNSKVQFSKMRLLASPRLFVSVRLSATTERIFTKFDIEEFYKIRRHIPILVEVGQ
jgi:hypothetical protein